MGVFLGFRDTQLGLAQTGQVFAQGIRQLFRLEGHMKLVPKGGVILGEGDVVYRKIPLPAGKAVEILEDEAAGDLPGPVRSEVIEDDAVVGLDGGHRGIPFHHHNGLDEFIRHILVVAVLDSGHGIRSPHPFPVHQGGIGLFHPLIAVVPVHGVIAAHHRGDLAYANLRQLGLQGFHIPFAAVGGHVPTVHEAMDVHLLEALGLGQLHQGVQMGQVAMHPAVGAQAIQVQGAVVGLAVFHRPQKGGILEKIPLPDGLGDPGQLLVYDAACADIQVTHLAVPHLPIRQAHVLPGRGDLGMGIGGGQGHDVLGAVGGDGIAVGLRPAAKAIQNDKGRKFLGHSGHLICHS